jgi:hypothetical protein
LSSSNGFRLSPQQAHLWAQLVPSPDTPYRAQCVVELQGPLDKPRLERAAREVVSRNEILRTTYRRLPGTGAAVQVPGDVPATVLRELDWTGPRAQWWSTLLEDLLLGPAENP